jgi:EAL domain-containing protein (putative c-di-GMP-specific phosphodiesterase class I)
MSDALKGAIATGALVPYFQPQFEAVDGSFFGAEVLVRWQHPDKGLLSPGDFLPIAEDMNLIEEIDRQVFGKSTARLGQWLQAGIQIPKLAINVSGPRLRSPALIEDLSKLPRAVRSRLSLEVLETIYVDSRDSDLEDTIGKLEELGVSLEIDDFGTGHASVSSIIALRPNVIKIDRQFIRDADKKQESLSVFQSIIGVAESVNLPVIAEGIETGSQALLARRLGCKALQGYGLCRPMSADQMHAWVSGRKKQRTAIIDELLADTPSSVRAA